MKITNPSNKAIENVRIFGVLYSIPAEGTLDNVPEAHARYWQESLHKFLILRKDKLEEVKKIEVEEIPTPTVSVAEVVFEEEIKEAEVEVDTKEGSGFTTEAVQVEEVVKVSKGKGKGKNK